jgi:hypothetical protein
LSTLRGAPPQHTLDLGRCSHPEHRAVIDVIWKVIFYHCDPLKPPQMLHFRRLGHPKIDVLSEVDVGRNFDGHKVPNLLRISLFWGTILATFGDLAVSRGRLGSVLDMKNNRQKTRYKKQRQRMSRIAQKSPKIALFGDFSTSKKPPEATKANLCRTEFGRGQTHFHVDRRASKSTPKPSSRALPTRSCTNIEK